MKRASGAACRHGAEVYAPGPSSVRVFRGLWGERAIITEDAGSDFVDLYVLALPTGTPVFKKAWIAPAVTLALDPKTRRLTEGVSLELPKSCAKRLPSYLAQETACWPTIRRRFPALKGASQPKCHCDGGLVPYAVAQASVDLTASKPTQRLTGKIACGCSS